ncbi:MAG: UDP-N-acetylmuramoyl-tripeptide--D-alanyl-D-alanine ligase [Proteobacteria bacterium]|nr:UDP-N-acetylmuramoyl-tripeptide--D-alanyl-D-alanine ligase [Pseudomonadota bacterium]
MDFSVNDILGAVRGTRISGSGETRVTGLSIDSRTTGPGDCFVALRGPNFDAHAFLGDVVDKGASLLVVERVEFDVPEGLAVIKVEDTMTALGDMAAYVRSVSSIPLVAISGSTGKTTTKEMVASILECSRRVLKTEGNKNNLVGMPLTLLRLKSNDQMAVVELGISEPHEMARLVEIALPDVALITNIGAGHLESLGSLEGVAKAKSALFTDSSPGCTRVVNLDDELVRKIYESYARERAHAHSRSQESAHVTFSLRGPSDVSVPSYEVLEGLAGVDVEYDVRGERLKVRLSSPALCNVMNGAAAIAAVLPLGASLSEIKEGLERFTPAKGRVGVTHVNGVTVIDDTYNANPDSMEEALKTLSFASGRKVAVVGDMLEIGTGAECAHAGVGKRAAELGIDVLVAIGSMADTVAHGALLAGLDSDSVFNFTDKASATEALGTIVRRGDSVLVKASRGMGLESIVEAIGGIIERGRQDTTACN